MPSWKPYLKQRTEIMTITPVVATAMLATNASNRQEKPGKIKQYAKDMTEGRWRFMVSDNIAFDKKGVLFDGQHRLLAIILSGIAQKMVVCYGEDRENFRFKDIGQPRTATDTLYCAGLIKSGDKKTAGVVRILYFGRATASAMPNDICMAVFNQYRDAIKYVSEQFEGSKAKFVNVAPVKAAIARAWIVEKDRRSMLDRFCKIILDPNETFVETEKAAVILRSWLTNQTHNNTPRRGRGRAARTSGQTTDQYGKTERALAYFLEKTAPSDSGLVCPKFELYELPHEREAADELDIQIAASIPKDSRGRFFIIPVAANGPKSGLSNAVSALNSKKLRLPKTIHCRSLFSVGDLVGIYATEHGIIGTAKIAKFESAPRADNDKFPFEMAFEDTKLFSESPVVIDEKALSKLDAYKDKPISSHTAGLFVQTARMISPHDFAVLTYERK
jgi:hypothetical protein